MYHIKHQGQQNCDKSCHSQEGHMNLFHKDGNFRNNHKNQSWLSFVQTETDSCLSSIDITWCASKWLCIRQIRLKVPKLTRCHLLTIFFFYKFSNKINSLLACHEHFVCLKIIGLLSIDLHSFTPEEQYSWGIWLIYKNLHNTSANLIRAFYSSSEHSFISISISTWILSSSPMPGVTDNVDILVIVSSRELIHFIFSMIFPI